MRITRAATGRRHVPPEKLQQRTLPISLSPSSGEYTASVILDSGDLIAVEGLDVCVALVESRQKYAWGVHNP